MNNEICYVLLSTGFYTVAVPQVTLPDNKYVRNSLITATLYCMNLTLMQYLKEKLYTVASKY